MRLIRCDKRWLNMDLLVEAEQIEMRDGSEGLDLRFAAPSPADVGASDWSAEPYAVRLTGREAAEVAGWLDTASGGPLARVDGPH